MSAPPSIASSGFTPINRPTNFVSSEIAATAATSTLDSSNSHFARNDTFGYRLTPRNPQIALYLGVDQHEKSYSKFDITDNVADDPHEKENMCPQKPPTRRRKAEPEKPAKRAKATDQAVLKRSTWAPKSGTTGSRKPSEGTGVQTRDGGVIQSTVTELPTGVHLSSRTLKILDCPKYHAPRELLRENIETSDRHGPSTTMDALGSSQSLNGLALSSDQTTSTTLPQDRDYISCVNAQSSDGLLHVLEPILKENEPTEVPVGQKFAKNSSTDVVGAAPCSDAHDLSDAFDDLPDEDLIVFTADSPLLDTIQNVPSSNSAAAIDFAPSNSVYPDVSNTAPSSDTRHVFSSDNASDFDMDWITIADFEETDTTNLVQSVLNCPKISPLEAIGPSKSTAIMLPLKKANGTVNNQLAKSSDIASTAEGYTDNVLHPPIVRPPFPEPIRDRSPIIGASATTYLRTCFRIGEVLREGCQAARRNKDVVLELYAKVDSSWREGSGVKQHFVLSDLFHDRTPRIEAVYEYWNANELWAYDSSRFLGVDGNKRLCRCVGKMKREKNAWKMVILNIWEATWDDVEYVRGIICAW